MHPKRRNNGTKSRQQTALSTKPASERHEIRGSMDCHDAFSADKIGPPAYEPFRRMPSMSLIRACTNNYRIEDVDAVRG